MKHLQLQFCSKNHRYIHSAITGQLYSGSTNRACARKLPPKVAQAMELCEHPYRLPPQSAPTTQPITNIPIKPLAQRLIRLCGFNFWLANRYAGCQRPTHRNAAEAIVAFCDTIGYENQKELCLPRALYAAKTSQHFKEHGVIFIGVFLPSRAMHAWVIESGQLADPYDSEWLHHRPVAALY